ncbi:MAG: chloride channel protein [Chthoniobacterales bacterium]
MWSKFARILGTFPRKTRPLIETCLVGLVAGLAAVAFQTGIDKLNKLIFTPGHWHSTMMFLLCTLAIICGGALFTGILLSKLCPEAAGSGIPQVKLSFWKDFGHSPPHIVFVKFLAGVVGIGSGLSLGREGPSVQIGGNLGSTIAGFLGVSKQGKRAAVAAGAASALAAAFNAPLAGVAFVLEEILEDLNSRFLGPVLVAAVIGAVVVHTLIGPDPAFHLPFIGEPTWRSYILTPLVAVLAALIGVGFQKGSLGLRRKMRTSFFPKSTHPVFGALVTWLLGMSAFLICGKLGTFGIGYGDLSDALNEKLAWEIAGLLLFTKWLSTVTCYGSGGCGGIFSPCLFFGAMCGAVISGLSSPFLGMTDSDRILLAVVGMSACLGAVVQAPVTSILIIFEMTHQFALLPGLIIAALLSQLVARRLVKENFYMEILTDDGHEMEHVVPPRDLRSWQNLPVSAVGQFTPVVVEITDLTTHHHALDSHGYDRFPVTEEGKLAGIVRREELELALKEDRRPKLESCATLLPGKTIREAEHLLIESTAGMIIIADKPQGMPLAVLTLHDLLRAQMAVAERE